MLKRLFAAENILNLLLVFVPIAILLELIHASAIAIFATSCLAIIPLAGLMGKATEHLAERLGQGVGGLLNATFGNAAELIIAVMALRAKQQWMCHQKRRRYSCCELPVPRADASISVDE